MLLSRAPSSGIATGGNRGAECHPWQLKNCQESGKRGEKSGKKEEKSGRKGKNQEGSITLPLLTDRTSYATGTKAIGGGGGGTERLLWGLFWYTYDNDKPSEGAWTTNPVLSHFCTSFILIVLHKKCFSFALLLNIKMHQQFRTSLHDKFVNLSHIVKKKPLTLNNQYLMPEWSHK